MSPNLLSYFRFGQTRSETKTTVDRSGKLLRPLTCSYLFLLVLGRLFLLALPVLLGICHPPPWSAPFSLHATALILLSLAKMRLSPTLSLFFLTIRYSGQTALAYLPTAFFVPLRTLFPFQQAQFVQVFPLKLAPFCMLFAGFCSINKLATSLFFSSYLTLVLFSPPRLLLRLSFYLKLSGRSGRNCFFSWSIQLQWVPGHSFLSGNDAANALARRGALLVHSAIPCSLSPLISRIHSCLFSDWRRTVSSKFFDTQVASISIEELMLLVMLNVFSLVYAARDIAFFSVLISSGLAESKILPVAPVDTRPRILLISLYTVQLRTSCTAHSLATLCLSTTSGPDPGELPWLWGPWSFAMPHPSKGVG